MQAQKAAAHVCKRRFRAFRARFDRRALIAQARKDGLRVRGHMAGAEFTLIEEFAIISRFGGGTALLFVHERFEH